MQLRSRLLLSLIRSSCRGPNYFAKEKRTSVYVDIQNNPKRFSGHALYRPVRFQRQRDPASSAGTL